MTSALATLRSTRRGSVVIVAVIGEIDLSNVAELRRGLFGSIGNDDDGVVVDLSQLGFIDSAGLGMMFELSDVLEERRQRLFLVVPPGTPPRRTIEVVGLASAIASFDDLDAALAAAQRPR